jgi:serine/threonine-protein kinase
MNGATFKVGDLLNNTYRIEAVLGRGGTSEVYQARSEISGNRVALKVLRAEYSRDEGFLNLMTREEDIREIRHDAIVRYYHNQRNDNGDVFLVMDFVDGPGLDKKLKSGGMPASELMVVAERVAEGLAAAHAKNIVHRDLSPDNIILRNGSPADAVIIDFGIAKDTNPGAETIVGNEFAGKYAYAAPEQLNGRSDVRSDIYALGALLLATFRGRAPEIGNNPMEVIEKKGLPLDTSGVPEPLKTLIDRMTAPDPETRLQDIGAVLALIRGFSGTVADDSTVIAPRPAASRTEAPRPENGGPVNAGPSTPAPARRTRGGLLAGMAAIFLLAALGGAWFAGLLDPLLGPSLPVAEPFTLTLEKPPEAPARAEGYVPSEDAAAALTQRIAALGGTADLTPARGQIVADWATTVDEIVEILAPLSEWRIEVQDNDIRVDGLTRDRDLVGTTEQALAQAAQRSGMALESFVELGPRILLPAAVDPLLTAYADCGALRLIDPPAQGYTNSDTLRVTGRFASGAARDGFIRALERMAGMRKVEVQAEIRNETLCLFDTVLPNAPPAGFGIAFSLGDTGENVPDGEFLVGQNPVIDLVIPSDLTGGLLYVSALDVSGKVFHLLPNVKRPENGVAALRDGRDGPVTVRLAHTLAEAADSGGKKLAFVVDETALGKTQIVVIHAEEEFIDGMRPTTESAQGYADALARQTGVIDTLDTQILTTRLP